MTASLTSVPYFTHFKHQVIDHLLPKPLGFISFSPSLSLSPSLPLNLNQRQHTFSSNFSAPNHSPWVPASPPNQVSPLLLPRLKSSQPMVTSLNIMFLLPYPRCSKWKAPLPPPPLLSSSATPIAFTTMSTFRRSIPLNTSKRVRSISSCL
uniref:Uncharacterized protein n=1 Tax=Nelumbo nucifera TaxID=4432 RepID=A0A822ZJK6_NELNU|nr:TPA_asm: hypothetical protein HUJ06_016231 [Nelumbo nucifera]